MNRPAVSVVSPAARDAAADRPPADAIRHDARSRRRPPYRSLQLLLPAMIVLSGLVVIVQQYAVARYYEDAHARESTAERALTRSAELANSARHYLEHDEGAQLARALEAAAKPPDLALVLDGDDRVIASSDPRWQGRRFERTPLGGATPALAAVRDGGQPRSQSLETPATIVAVHPLTPWTASDDADRSDRRLVVFGESCTEPLREGRQRILLIALTSGALVLGLTALFWLVIDRMLLRPLDRLLAPAGDECPAQALLRGRRPPLEELARIAEAFESLATTKRELEHALASQNRLTTIIDESHSEIFVVDAETYRVIDANRSARENLGYSAEEIVELHPADKLAELDREESEALLETVRRARPPQRSIETRHRRKDGTTYPVRSHLQYMGDATPPVFVVICQDVTAERRREQHLRLRERAVEEVEAGIVISDVSVADRPIVYVNRALCEMTGYTAEELIGRSPRLFQGEAQDQPGVRRILEAQRRGASVQTRLDCVRKGGERFVIRLTLSPVHDADGVLTHYIGIHEDITRELETEERLLETQRIEAVGQLAGGIAHDFNNLLDVVVGNLEPLVQGTRDARQLERLGKARDAAQMGARLTRRLLAFAREGSLDPSIVDVNARVRDTLPLLRASVGEPIVLEAELAEGLWRTRVDPSEVDNAVVNLVINARDALGSGGRIRIVTANARVSSSDDPSGLPPGDFVRLSVSDNGVGMSEEVRARAFEPFYTTKGPGRGTGLGLASVYGFARQSCGTATIETVLGGGATVSVYLPRHVVGREAVPAREEPAPTHVGEGRVLVVEDNDDVREITLLRLRTLGLETLEARDGHEAMRILASGERVDLVLSDVVMAGGVSGHDLVAWIRERGLDCSILLVSGYAETVASDAPRGAEQPRILAKPYSLATLRGAIAELLGAPACEG